MQIFLCFLQNAKSLWHDEGKILQKEVGGPTKSLPWAFVDVLRVKLDFRYGPKWSHSYTLVSLKVKANDLLIRLIEPASRYIEGQINPPAWILVFW
jgi:hypothetical protein